MYLTRAPDCTEKSTCVIRAVEFSIQLILTIFLSFFQTFLYFARTFLSSSLSLSWEKLNFSPTEIQLNVVKDKIEVLLIPRMTSFMQTQRKVKSIFFWIVNEIVYIYSRTLNRARLTCCNSQ